MTLNRVTPLVGDRVVSANGSPVGRIDDVLVDIDTGRVSHVLVLFEHVLGLEDRRFAVRPDVLEADGPTHPSESRPSVVLDVDTDELTAPETATLLLV